MIHLCRKGFGWGIDFIGAVRCWGLRYVMYGLAGRIL